MPQRIQNSNKGSFGKVLNFAGSKNYIGAAYLSTIPALKAGAGLVALASVKEVISSVSKLLPEAVYLSQTQGLKDIGNYTVISVGSGLGQGLKAKLLFFTLLKRLKSCSTPVVIDADGLNILSKTKFCLPQNTIITPHPMEAARLLNVKLEDVLNNLEESAKELTRKYNCVTVLKTHRTIICNKNQEIFINQHGNSALAKAGSGDVLVGIISGLLAQNVELFEAAKLGVYLHSRAGEIASQDLTEYSVLASDTINNIPKAILEIL